LIQTLGGYDWHMRDDPEGGSGTVRHLLQHHVAGSMAIGAIIQPDGFDIAGYEDAISILSPGRRVELAQNGPAL
jgi:hypothetical protein